MYLIWGLKKQAEGVITGTLRKRCSWGEGHPTRAKAFGWRNPVLLSRSLVGRGPDNKYPDFILFPSSNLLVPPIGWVQLEARGPGRPADAHLTGQLSGLGESREGWGEAWRVVAHSFTYLCCSIPLMYPCIASPLVQILPVFYLLLRSCLFHQTFIGYFFSPQNTRGV